MTQSAATRSIVMEREMPHPPEKIWRALTQGPLIEDWLMANDFQPVVGHRFTLRTTPAPPHWNGVTEGEVLVVEPPERLSYSWNATGDEAETGPRTIVTWTLEPTPTGALVRMEHAGFRAQHAHNFHGASNAWNGFFAKLEQLVAKLE